MVSGTTISPICDLYAVTFEYLSSQQLGNIATNLITKINELIASVGAYVSHAVRS